jgi:hypothetical protein
VYLLVKGRGGAESGEALADSIAAPSPPPTDTAVTALPVAPYPTVLTVDSTVAAIPGDSLPPEGATPAPGVSDSAPAAPGVPVSGPIIRIDGLAVESATQTTEGVAAGYRVIQTLNTGARVELTVLPLGASGDTLQAGQFRGLDLPEGGSTGATVFGTFLVSARAPIPSDQLQALLRRLIEAPVP